MSQKKNKSTSRVQLNLKVALSLLSVAVFFFIGIIAKYLIFPVN